MIVFGYCPQRREGLAPPFIGEGGVESRRDLCPVACERARCVHTDVKAKAAARCKYTTLQSAQPHRGRIAFGGGHRSADSHRRPRARAGLHGHNMDLAPVDI